MAVNVQRILMISLILVLSAIVPALSKGFDANGEKDDGKREYYSPTRKLECPPIFRCCCSSNDIDSIIFGCVCVRVYFIAFVQLTFLLKDIAENDLTHCS